MEAVWTYLMPLRADAATQMAVDALLLEQCSQSPDLAFLRFYSMNPPGVTIGRNQRWANVIDSPLCRDHGWEWVRRPTGGGALLHHRELNYAMIASHNVFPQSSRRNLRTTFGQAMHGLAAGLGKLGFEPDVHLGQDVAGVRMSRSAHGLCERSLTRFEISVDGLKAVAAAQLNLSCASLQHGTIYLQAPGPGDRFWPQSAGDAAGTTRTGWWSLPPDGRSGQARWTMLADALRDGISGSLGASMREAVLDDSLLEQAEAQKAAWDLSCWHRHR